MFSKRFFSIIESAAGLESLPPYLRLGTRGVNRKRLNQVPEYRRNDPSKNNKVEKVRNQPAAGGQVISASDAKYIFSKYNIEGINVGETKQLGTSGMNITRDNDNVATGMPIYRLYK